jgi:DNA polymerase III delta prime subunit
MQNIIGQSNVIDIVSKWLTTNHPRFILISGPEGSGRGMIADYIATKVSKTLIYSGIKVEDVRSIIALAYKLSEPTVYILENIEKMSPAAKNALLKVTEEPPRKAYFIMTTQNIDGMLATIRSRATVLYTDPYSRDELFDYIQSRKIELSKEEINITLNICAVPGEIDTLIRYNITEFHSFVYKVLDNIGKVTGVNAFKIANQLKFKEDETGYDVLLFMKTLNTICISEMIESKEVEELVKFKDTVRITSKYISELMMSGLNKQATFDMWILEMREVWKEDN